jgi:hypothetical protein
MEIWKNVKGFQGYYQVSNLGRVKRLATKFICGCKGGGKRYISFKEKILLPCSYTNKYLCVTLSTQGKKERPMIHRLVALHFLDNNENKQQVNHKDGNVQNNIVENLEWVTQSENMLHSYYVLKNQNVNQIELINTETKEVYKSIKDCSKKTGIKYSTLYAYITKKLPNKTKITIYVK